MGGKSPNIIFADADLDNAVNGVMAGIFAASGQTCMAGSRVLVQAQVYDRVCEMLAERGSRMIAGDPLDPATQLGPARFAPAAAEGALLLRDRRDEGSACIAGGKRLERQGYFVAPTVYRDVPPTAASRARKYSAPWPR